MIYQQEVKEINDFYDKYKERKIVYSKEVTQDIGLVQRDTSIRMGDESISSALISSTMESFVLLARLEERQRQLLYDSNSSLSVQLKFISKETGKTILLTIHTKIVSLNSQGLDQKDLFFLAMSIRRKIPDDLIRIYGYFFREAEEKNQNKKRRVECLLLANEIKSDCQAEKITKDELVVSLDDDSPYKINDKAITIIKVINTGEVVEIIGTISGKDYDISGSSILNISYSMDDQSPRFGYSIHVLKNLINN